MIIRLTLNAKSVNVESLNNREIEVTVDIDDSEIQTILENIDLQEIYDHLDGSNVLNANLFLKYCTLEDVFEHFNPVELKTRLAQYLID